MTILRDTFAAFVLSLILFGCQTAQTTLNREDASPTPLAYTVDLTDRSDDTFKVTLSVNDLGVGNGVFQFAATAPGTYQTMDIGRFVRSFKAVDSSGAEVPSQNISTNQWQISEPQRVARISYSLAETWDTPVDRDRVYPMAGTSIEEDHALINGQAVFGFPVGMQARPIRVEILRPDSWLVGTALATDPAGRFLAEDYDHVVDSPILLGRLSKASLNVRGTAVEVFAYSKTDKVQAAQILESVTDILNAAGEFLVDLPVERYALLFHFEDVTAGAWEHSYSSEYVFSESDFSPETLGSIRNIVAHEFFHIVTPLNIHSEVVEYFNFEEPVASEHVWLYEGTTEWVAHAAQFRAGLIDIDTYLARLSGKMKSNDRFDPDFSVSQMGLESFSAKGQREWGNIYQRGALVAGLIDIKLLETSAGTRGLREVLIELSQRFGPSRPFSEATFFEDFVESTHPDVLPIVNRHIRDTETLPMAEYYRKLGILYQEEFNTGEKVAGFGLGIGVEEDNLVIEGVGPVAAACGLAAGDVLMELDGGEVNLESGNQVFGQFRAVEVDQEFAVKVRRGEDELDFTCAKRLIDRIDTHVFTLDPDATAGQLALREAWMQNLPLPGGTQP